MKLERHQMAGFNHLGGTFDLDLCDLRAGLVAVIGPNGAGKTSLGLEGPFAGLYGPGLQTRAFPSREGPLARYATARDARIESVWTLDGVGTFKVRVNVDSVRRTTEAVLIEILPDGREVPLNDGKTTTYRQAVAERFPSLRSLLASAFAGQTRRGSFGELDQGERIALFRELADLQHLEDKSATAKRCAQIADGIAARIRAALDVLRRDATPEQVEELHQRAARIEAEIDGLVGRRRDGVKRITAAEQDRAQRQVAAQQHAAVQATLDAARTALQRVERDLAALSDEAAQQAYRRELTDVAKRCASALGNLELRRHTLVAAADAATKDRGQRIANNEALLADVTKIRDAVARMQQAERDLAEHRKDEQAQRADLEHAREQWRAAQTAWEKAGVAASELEAVRRRAGLLATVKFGDECGVDPACPLVTDAVAARARMPELETLAQQAPQHRDGVATWKRKVAGHEAALGEVAAAIAAAERIIRECVSDVKRAPYLDAATARIAEYRQDQATADQAIHADLGRIEDEQRTTQDQRQRDEQAAADRLQRQRDDVATQRAALTTHVEQARAQVSQAEGKAAETAGAQQALAEAEAALKVAQATVAEIDRTVAKMEAERDGLQRQQQELAAKQAQAADAQHRLRTVEDELLAWQTLARALGRDGLQRLEIDAAGPVVSDLANQLLEVGWGPRFGVQIVTQVATADKRDTKEKFTIEVLDNEHGGEVRDIGDLSGGERVVVEEAIRAALACYVNLRSRQRCRTLWRDEADGGLSEENGPRYVAMLRKLRELSGADQVLFITHRTDLAALADAVVEVRDGQVVEIRRAA
jgi:exonuclease SbcC